MEERVRYAVWMETKNGGKHAISDQLLRGVQEDGDNSCASIRRTEFSRTSTALSSHFGERGQDEALFIALIS